MGSRRRFLARAGTVAAGVMGISVGPGSATPDDPSDEDKRTGTNGKTITNPREYRLSEAEVESEIERLKERYGKKTAYYTYPTKVDFGRENERGQEAGEGGDGSSDVSLQEVSAQSETNAVLDATFKHAYDVRNSFNQLLAKTNHYLNRYKTNVTDLNGRRVYFYKQLSYSDDYEPFGNIYNANTRRIESKVDLKTNAQRLNSIRPEGSVALSQGGSSTFTIGYGGASISSPINTRGGTLSPIPSYLTFGANGQWGFQLEGKIEGLASMTGLADVRTASGHDFNWTTHVKAGIGEVP